LVRKSFKRQSSFSGRKAGSFTGLTGAPFHEGTLEGAEMHVSLRELIQPHVETLFEDLPADVQSYVAKDFRNC
jgi:hypothetical protein